MDEVIERLAGGEVMSDDRTDHLMLIMLARILMTQMALADMLSEMAPQDDVVVVESDKAGWGGLDA